MRRFALSVLTACGFSVLAACSAGTGLTHSGTATPDTVLLTTGAGQANNFAVLPGAAIQISATAQKGSGPFALIVPDVAFTWDARYVDPATDSPSVASYQYGPTGVTKPCPARAASSTYPQELFFRQLAPTMVPLGPSEGATTVYLVTSPASATPPPYCIVVDATPIGGGNLGSKTIYVGPSPGS